MDECYFKCSLRNKSLTTAGASRIHHSIIQYSIQRGDGLHIELQNQLDANEHLTIKCHKTCVSNYTSKSHLKTPSKRHKDAAMSPSGTPPEKRSRRSEICQFNFKEHCLFCGDKCVMVADPRHPDRWRKASICMTADRGQGSKSFKQAILDVCDSRNDIWGSEVRVRVQGAVCDLHAADGRYHHDCRKLFMAKRSVQAAELLSIKQESEVDTAFDYVVDAMKSDMSKIWTSIDIFNLYQMNEGNIISRTSLIKKISNHFGKDLLVLSSSGLANVLVFRSTASGVLRLVEDDDDDISITNVAKQILKESAGLTSSKSEYKTRIDKEAALNDASPTLLSLLSMIAPKMESSLAAALIGNIITNIVTKRPTLLQVALGNFLRERRLIENFFDFGVTCSYDEVLRFKGSAAAASAQSCSSAISDSKDALVQTVADNFDANISSQNGLKSTHSLALLITQNEAGTGSCIETNQTIRRLKKEELKHDVVPDIPVQTFHGPKKPEMPQDEKKHHVLPLKILAQQNVLVRRSQNMNFEFLKAIVSDASTPEFNGYNTMLSREQGHAVKPKTIAVYTPLIDMVPSDPSTMMTAMIEAQKRTRLAGQDVTVFTNDQQLYRVAVNIMWVYPDLFSNFIPRLGGMHMLMSFVGAIGTLMENSGLEEIMKCAFGGVAGMLSGKKFPQNTRALRLVVEEVLRSVMQGTDIDSHTDLMALLEQKSSSTRTAKHWVDNLIKPVLIMMTFVRAEREGEWPLHLWAVKEMLPYFFAAGHVNYARYGLYYLRSMECLPKDILARFLKGEHVMHHNPGIWNGIWSDMFIETTFMRYGKSAGGLVGITLQPSTVKRWALSLHICSRLVNDVISMRNTSKPAQVTQHKEELPGRIKSDCNDREKIRNKLEMCIDPLNCEDNADCVVNIVSGTLSPESVNVDDAVTIGRKQMQEFESSWPEGFNHTISKRTVTMSVSKKKIKVAGASTFDTELIYSRVMGMMHSRQIDIKDVFRYELAPVPTSMFDDNGEMRITKSKSTLKRKLQVEQSARTSQSPTTTVLDGCAILWIIHWPGNGTVQDFIDQFQRYVFSKLNEMDIFLVFDRYYEGSIKSGTRRNRAGKEASRKYKLDWKTPLPPQQVVLTVTENKQQIIAKICEQLQERAKLLSHAHKLLITGPNPVPQEIQNGVLIQRQDLRTTHEEADVIIPQQVIALVNEGTNSIKVICDDTDVFVLLVYFYKQCKLNATILMDGTSSKRTLVDIGATAQKQADIVPHLLAAHALSGCDTTADLWGIGKAKVIKVLQAGQKLPNIGNPDVSIEEITKEASSFVCACYGSKQNTLSTARYEIWRTRTARKNITSNPKLKSLPPTTEAFVENVKRVHFQVCIWKAALESEPPSLLPTDYGWYADSKDKTLSPVTVSEGTALAPPEILQMVRCGCATEEPCSTGRCGCRVAQLACTAFCNCHMESCANEWTKQATTDDNQDDDTDENSDD